MYSRKKHCEFCNKIFVFTASAKKYCSEKCFKLARKEAKKIWCKNNKARIKKQRKTYRERNRERIKDEQKRCYLKYKEERSIKAKEYRKLHKKEKKLIDKKYYHAHKEQNKINCKKYASTHRNQLNFYLRKWKQKHPMSVFIDRLRHRIYMALKGNDKSQSTMKLIGCSINELIQHLETQFTKDMNWKNYGKWHVDHIKPCAKFDLSQPKEQLKCFNYKNLQPLWAKDNLIKGIK